MKPLLRGHFHQAMFFVALGAGLFLAFNVKGPIVITSVVIYIVCALLMFGTSAIYHRVNWSPSRRLLWKKLDHVGIYIMIAGTATPIATLSLGQSSSIKLLITIWAFAFVGLLQSLFFVNLPKFVSAVIYLIMGYLAVPYLSEIQETMGELNVTLLLIGGLAYSIGALSYGLKWPKLKESIFGYHELFHILVIVGAVLHFVAISSLALDTNI